MEICIGMVGASGSGKTSLMTAMFEDMSRQLSVHDETRGFVRISHDNAETQMAIGEARRRFADCVRSGSFIASRRTSECSQFVFHVTFTRDGLEKAYDFRIMDYPGGLISDPDRFAKIGLPHIRKSVVLFVPIDAVALVSWFAAKISDPGLAEKVITSLQIDRVKEIVKLWTKERISCDIPRLLFFVPVKTESFYADNRNCAGDRSEDITSAVRELYVEPLRRVCQEGGVEMQLHPVDTYGCVKLEAVKWDNQDNVLKETFKVSNGKDLAPRGAVNLFSTTLSRFVKANEEVAKHRVEASRDIIQSRGVISKLFHAVFGDAEKEQMCQNKTAAEFYEDACNAIFAFSTSKRSLMV